MPNLTTNQTPYLDPNSGSGWPGYIIPGAVQQQSFGNVTTLIYPFFTNISYYATSSTGNTLFFYGTTNSTSNKVNVSDYNNHAFSVSTYLSGSTSTVSGSSTTSSISVSSSIDGFNWVGEFSMLTPVSASTTITTSSIFRLAGRRTYFLASYSTSGSVNNTASLYLLSGQ